MSRILALGHGDWRWPGCRCEFISRRQPGGGWPTAAADRSQLCTLGVSRFLRNDQIPVARFAIISVRSLYSPPHGQLIHEAGAEAPNMVYFDDVPPSFGALIRHIQGRYIAKGGRVQDESILKRRLRKF